MGNNLDSFKICFIHSINMLIDAGAHETIEEIERQCENGVIYDYLMQKYAGTFGGQYLDENKHMYQKQVNEYMQEITVDMKYNARRKYGISNPESGLLMLVNFVVDYHT